MTFFYLTDTRSMVIPGWVVKMLLSNSREWRLSMNVIGTRVKSKGAPATKWQNIVAIFTNKSFILGFRRYSEKCQEDKQLIYTQIPGSMIYCLNVLIIIVLRPLVA